MIKTRLYRNILLSTIFINILVLAVPLYTLNVYDRVLPDFDQPTLLVLFIGIVLALVFDLALKILRSSALNNLADQVSYQVESSYFKDIISDHKFSHISTGQKLTMFQELAYIRVFQITKVLPFLFDIPFFLLFLGVIYLISPALFYVPLLGAVFFICIGLCSLFISAQFDNKKNQTAQNKTNLLLETLQSLETLRLMHASSDVLEKWKDALLRHISSEKPEQRIQNFMVHTASFVALFVTASVIFIGAFEVSENTLTLGGLIAISILSSRALTPISAMVPVLSGYQGYKNACAKISSISVSASDTQLGKQSVELSPKKLSGSISLKNISHEYGGQSQQALSDVTLSIKTGERLAVIGASGAGKSTLIKIATGILTPTDGQILWDQFQINAISRAQRSEHIGFSSQDDFLFDGSLADNVFMGVNKGFAKNEKHIENVCFLSGLDLFMEQTGYGWDTPILEKGHNLSTGAKQSISLARAMMHDPKILILDEPLNGLDFTIEKRLIDHLPKWLKGKTFIMVTHRTSLLPLADYILLLEKGKVKTYGERDEIIEALS